jgi:hypothetical protein
MVVPSNAAIVSSCDLPLRFDMPYNGGGCDAQNGEAKRRQYGRLDNTMLDRQSNEQSLNQQRTGSENGEDDITASLLASL